MKALALAAILAALLAALPHCGFARIRYHEGAEASQALACFPSEDEPNAIDCWDYFGTHLRLRGAREVRL